MIDNRGQREEREEGFEQLPNKQELVRGGTTRYVKIERPI